MDVRRLLLLILMYCSPLVRVQFGVKVEVAREVAAHVEPFLGQLAACLGAVVSRGATFGLALQGVDAVFAYGGSGFRRKAFCGSARVVGNHRRAAGSPSACVGLTKTVASE